MKLSKSTTSTELFKESVRAMALQHPNSIIADLLTHFSPKIVMEIIQIYSGQQLVIPRIESVWRSYRNKVVRDTLDMRNTLSEREQLAGFFGTSSQYISVIYSNEKKKHPVVSTRTTTSVAERVYRDKVRGAFKDAEHILFAAKKRKGGRRSK